MNRRNWLYAVVTLVLLSFTAVLATQPVGAGTTQSSFLPLLMRPVDTPTATATPVPTNTPLPTNTPVPTNTLQPTNTPLPTNTVAPTNTPQPTNTPAPTKIPVPTNTPQPTATDAPPGGCSICSSDTYNCGDFSTQAAAQACHDYCWAQVGYDVHNLDSDGDGEACESLPPFSAFLSP